MLSESDYKRIIEESRENCLRVGAIGYQEMRHGKIVHKQRKFISIDCGKNKFYEGSEMYEAFFKYQTLFTKQ